MHVRVGASFLARGRNHTCACATFLAHARGRNLPCACALERPSLRVYVRVGASFLARARARERDLPRTLEPAYRDLPSKRNSSEREILLLESRKLPNIL